MTYLLKFLKHSCTVLFFLCFFHSCSARDITLVEEGTTDYTIVLPELNTLVEQNAAAQLQKTLLEISEVQFPIVRENVIKDVSSRSFIFIGNTERTRNEKFNGEGMMQTDAVNVRFVGRDIFLFGGDERGTLYSTLEFLQRYLNCEWWSSTEFDIPKMTKVVINPINFSFVPPFKVRGHLSYHSTVNPFYSTVLRENGDFQKLDENWGGHHEIVGWAHTFSQILPPSTYFKKHPEWYINPSSGLPFQGGDKMPNANETQLCVTNSDMTKEFIKNVKSWIRKNPKAEVISISQNDINIYCKTNECNKIIAQEGGVSGLILRFVNEVANAFKTEYPSLKFETLAYDYTENPPKITKPADNVIIRIAPILTNNAKPLSDITNKTSKINIENWSKISKHNYYWGYNANFSYPLLPHPSLSHLKDDLLFLKKLNFEGVFIQSIASPYYQTEEFGYFNELHTWITGQLMWNPEQNYEELMTKFFTRYYGPAGTYLKIYFDLIEQGYLDSNEKLSVFNRNMSFMSETIVTKGEELYQNALKSVSDNPKLLTRVKKAKVSFDFAKIFLYTKGPSINNLESADERQTTYNKLVEHFLSNLNDLQVSSEDASKFRRYVDRQAGKLDDLRPSMESLNDLLDKGSKEFTIQQNVFTYYKLGSRTKKITDDDASDNLAAYMDASKSDWAIQYNVGNLEKPNVSWEITSHIKIDGDVSNIKGSKIMFGVYDPKTQQNISISEMEMDKVSNKHYNMVTLQNVHLKNGYVIFFSVVNPNPKVKGINIDKIDLKQNK
ncbi:DUF4838 domain-containing protein [Parapedobacter sp. DT-150]|uniref:DUF4838 domain-containing protein n=1 Tax=Parapedobacter sp. DT-150 TaxID=3396162 RepID=UPI003F19D122